MNLRKIFKIFSVSFLVGYATIFTASAQTTSCSWLPSFLCDLLTPENPLNQVEARIRAAFFIAIGIIILVAIAYGIYNAYKYIKGGDSMEEANKGMRAILFGIGSLFVIMMGIVVVLFFFGSSINDLFPKKICIDAPESAGCYACQNAQQTDNGNICDVCDSNSDQVLPSELIVGKGSDAVRIVNEDGSISSTNGVGSGVSCTQKVVEVNN